MSVLEYLTFLTVNNEELTEIEKAEMISAFVEHYGKKEHVA